MGEGDVVAASASINRTGSVSTVVVSGEVDLATAPMVEESISQAIAADGVDTVLVDLAAVQFLDSSGIALLLKGRRLADQRGVAYRVGGANGMIQRVLELGGVWEHLGGNAS